eukprot:TRINITY_DN626_c0_g1_i3.p1 TRINITY_DN626_c0_g1~~TRINITY_DN626_c0_g1_i3.p1  ORF type:complete len:637 (+),score=184.93 TRINITY_DN626_c0_g1_i3:219-2129(+)
METPSTLSFSGDVNLQNMLLSTSGTFTLEDLNELEQHFQMQNNGPLSQDELLRMFVGGGLNVSMEKELRNEFNEFQRGQMMQQQHGIEHTQQHNTVQNPQFTNGGQVFQSPQGFQSPQASIVPPPSFDEAQNRPLAGVNNPYSNESAFINPTQNQFLQPPTRMFSPSTPQTPQSPVNTPDVYPTGGPIYQQPKNKEPQHAQKLLGDIQKYQVEQKAKIETIFQTQKQFMTAPQQQGFQQLSDELKQLKEQIDMELKGIVTVYDTVILEPPDLQKLLWLRQDLEIQMKQIELLVAELNRLVSPNSNVPLATLVILKQPFPQVITKNKQIPEDSLQVQLLTASSIHIQSITQVKAAMLCDIAHGKGGTSKALDMDSQNLEQNTRVAKFPLKFVAGTKKAPGTIKFGMQVVVSGTNTPLTVESNISMPMVVITNECQWEGSAGTLLKKEAFSNGQLEVSWARFANALQHHFLKATRQELMRPRRILSQYDLRYLQLKFFKGKALINQKDFDDFWSWFGKAMQKIRYQRHITQLWQNGLIYGFMSREDVDASLKNQEPGTFIMRFSERHGGQFAIAYTGTERPPKIKHYLVQPNDTAAAKKTLPDFLEEQPQFVTLLVLTNGSINSILCASMYIIINKVR